MDRIAVAAVVGRLVTQPRGLLVARGQRAHAGPFRLRGRGHRGALDGGFVRSDEGYEIADADDSDGTVRGRADRWFVQQFQYGAA